MPPRSGAVGIAAVRTVMSEDHPNALWVEIDTSEGVTGLGETWYGPAAAAEFVHGVGAPYLLGLDPRLIAVHQRALYTLWSRKGVGAEGRAASALDIALWDVVGKLYDQPLHQALGGASRRSVPVYNTCVGPGYQRSPLAVGDPLFGPTVPAGKHEDLWSTLNAPGELAEELLESGIATMKVLPLDATLAYGAGELVSDAFLRRGLEPLRRIREAVGDRIEIALECRGRWNVPSARKVAERAAEFDVCWLEDPVRNENFEALAGLRRASPVPLAGGESLGSSFRHLEMMSAGAVDIVLSDLSWNGGITEARRVADLASAQMLPFGLHDCSGPVNLAASVHLAAHFPNVFAQEIVRAYLFGWYAEVADGLPRLIDGELEISDRPGHGVELNRDFVGSESTHVRTSSRTT
jgi:L-alanine-DL-glutamate epimerase-like enolase superfamily enzyme